MLSFVICTGDLNDLILVPGTSSDRISLIRCICINCTQPFGSIQTLCQVGFSSVRVCVLRVYLH